MTARPINPMSQLPFSIYFLQESQNIFFVNRFPVFHRSGVRDITDWLGAVGEDALDPLAPRLPLCDPADKSNGWSGFRVGWVTIYNILLKLLLKSSMQRAY